MKKRNYTLGLFEAYGVELEYMIVDSRTLDIAPVADSVLSAVAGEIASEVPLGRISWSNELVLHVLELKTTDPEPKLDGLANLFAENVRKANEILAQMDAMLMPTAMHPWMKPLTEMRLWQHEYSPVYEAYNRIFDCRGHGWANLQSAHLNLPFANEEEFGRLHAAIRLLMPIMPALAASSPIIDGVPTSSLDSRMDVYRFNSARVPSIAAAIIPEAVFNYADYNEQILERMYADIAPHDPEGILRHEWLNSRGAIARFDRGAIEIRVLDVQECPAADLAVLWFISAVLRRLVEESDSSFGEQKSFETHPLAKMFLDVIKNGEQTPILDTRYLAALALEDHLSMSAGKIWQTLYEQLPDSPQMAEHASALSIIFEHGCLARRILTAAGKRPGLEELHRVYGELCECLAENRMFLPG